MIHSTSSRRSTRDRPAKAPLSEDAVVDAALAILTSEGLDAVTMRRVAAALDTGPASLYVYVPSREALLLAILDRVTATIELEAPDPTRWREQLHALLQRMRDALVAHPGLAGVTLGGPHNSEAIMQVTENMLGVVAAGGIGPQDAAWTLDLFVLLVTAVATEDEVRRAFPHQAAELQATFASLPRARFPLLTAHAAEMVAGDTGERFHYAIDVVIDGILARAGHIRPE